MDDNSPSYELISPEPRPSAFADTGPKGFLSETAANWRLGWGKQLFDYYSSEWDNTYDPNFNPWDHLDGYEEYTGALVRAQNENVFNTIKQQIESKIRDRETIAQGEWGLIAGLAGGVLDPVNLVPIPGSTGIGFVRGALKAGATNVALAGVTEPVRISLDPTAEWSEMKYSLTVAGLLGAGIGGGVGALRGFRAKEHALSLRALANDINLEEGMNYAREFNAGGENYIREFGHTGATDASGAYSPVHLAEVDVPVREKLGADGVNYYFDDTQGWIRASDRGLDAPRPALGDVLDQLGVPERTTERRLKVDDVALKNDYENGRWDQESPNGRKAIPRETFKSVNEYLTFRQLETVWKSLLPKLAKETDVEYVNRVQDAALKDLEASRASSAVGKAAGLERLLDLGNRSIVAKTIRLFRNDNTLTDLPLALGGDFGWMTRANANGVATPASVLIRAQQHQAAFFEVKQALDTAFLQFASNNKVAQGRKVLGQNVSAAAWRIRNAFQSKIGDRVLTYDTFKKMATEAIWRSDDFEVDGFKVPPEAREVAKTFSRLMEKYDAMERELGIFADERSVKRTIAHKQAYIVDLKSRIANVLWGASGEPDALQPAIRVNNQTFTGKTHADAVAEAMRQLGTDIKLTPENYGYINKADSALDSAQPRFRTQDDLIQDRVDSLGEYSSRRYDDLIEQLRTVEKELADAELELSNLGTHTFRDQFGNIEGYFPRFWNKPAILAAREKFKALLTHWYSRDNPIDADVRADQTIDDMINGVDNADETPVMGVSHLNKRRLNVPNSYSIVDPVHGELRISDFIETDMEAVADVYFRKVGVRIEMARKFGDMNLSDQIQKIKDYFDERYIEPAEKSGKDVGAIINQRDEYIRNIGLIRDDLLGRLRNRDPWAVDNRISRFLKDHATLAMMGRVMLTTIPEAARVPMVNGFGTAYRSLFHRMFSDFDSISANVEFQKLTGEVYDMVKTHAFARVAENNSTDVRGGTWIERFLNNRVPGFHKLTGLTPWTTISKSWAMFSGQHVIMTDAIAVGNALREGADAPAQAVSNLAALGISLRDAVLLSKMPYEINDGGKLILPSVDKWAGAEGQRARQLLLDGLTGISRRTIITPSMADLPMMSRGVLTWKGRKVMESDLLTMPFQFLSYGLAATQKLALSSLQGRDANAVSGALAMLALGSLSVYLKTPENAWRNKSLEDILLESYEAAGIGGFYFTDLNHQIELFSRNQMGVRPMLGLDPKFGKQSEAGDYIDATGRGVGLYYDLYKAFTDDTLSTSNRAQIIRRGIWYNNVLWWGSAPRDIASGVAKQIDGQ